MTKNVFITTLSVLKSYQDSTACFTNKKKRVTLDYRMQQRPGFEFSHWMMKQYVTKKYPDVAHPKFDKIIVLCTPETVNPDTVDVAPLLRDQCGAGMPAAQKLSVWEAFKYQICANVTYNFSTPDAHPLVREESYTDDAFIKLDVTASEDADNLFFALVKEIKSTCDTQDETLLYIDSQGGQRTSNLVIQSLLSVMDDADDTLRIASILAGESDTSFYRYRNVKGDYGILTNVSGMKAFLQYGKADLLEKRVSQLRDTEPHKQLINKTVAVDRAISVCDTSGMIRAINDLWATFRNEDTEQLVAPYNYFAYEIKNEYQKVIRDGHVYLPALIAWANEKQFYQQALTLAEAVFPTFLMEEGWLCCNDEDTAWLTELSKKNTYSKIVRSEQVRNNVYMKCIAWNVAETTKDADMPSKYGFTAYVGGVKLFDRDAPITKGEMGNVSEPVYAKLKDMMAAFLFIKTVRNAINHASDDMEDNLKNTARNGKYCCIGNDVIAGGVYAIVSYTVEHFLDTFYKFKESVEHECAN